MSTTPTTFTPAPRSPVTVASAMQTARDALGRLTPPPAPGMNPGPSWFEAVADHFRQVALIMNDWSGAVGYVVSDNAPCNLDMRLFDTPFSDAIDGNATYELERCAEVLREEHREVA